MHSPLFRERRGNDPRFNSYDGHSLTVYIKRYEASQILRLVAFFSSRSSYQGCIASQIFWPGSNWTNERGLGALARCPKHIPKRVSGFNIIRLLPRVRPWLPLRPLYSFLL